MLDCDIFIETKLDLANNRGMILVNIHAAKTRLSSLLKDVEERGVCVRICRNGKPVAELRPIAAAKDPFAVDEALRVVFHEDPSLPLDASEWPVVSR